MPREPGRLEARRDGSGAEGVLHARKEDAVVLVATHVDQLGGVFARGVAQTGRVVGRGSTGALIARPTRSATHFRRSAWHSSCRLARSLLSHLNAEPAQAAGLHRYCEELVDKPEGTQSARRPPGVMMFVVEPLQAWAALQTTRATFSNSFPDS